VPAAVITPCSGCPASRSTWPPSTSSLRAPTHPHRTRTAARREPAVHRTRPLDRHRRSRRRSRPAGRSGSDGGGRRTPAPATEVSLRERQPQPRATVTRTPCGTADVWTWLICRPHPASPRPSPRRGPPPPIGKVHPGREQAQVRRDECKFGRQTTIRRLS
jgi:hypothetical protein